MKVLHVIADMDPEAGGVCQGLRTIIYGLSQQGISNEVASLDSPGSPYLKNDAFTVYALGPGVTPWQYSSKLVPWLVENLHRFDAVIAHGLWLYHGFAVYKAMEQLKLNKGGNALPKVLICPHGMLDPYFQRAAGRKLKAIRNTVYWKLVEGRVINAADGLLFTAETERRLAHEPFTPYHPKNESVVGLGVKEPPPFTPLMQTMFLQRCPGLNNSPYILFLGRIHKKKGVDLLIQAYLDIADKLVNESSLPKLVIAGPGQETDYGRGLQLLIAKYPRWKDSIVFTGMLTGEAKWGAFYGCEAFVLPTHQENFGIAIVEALACGKPVLISNQTNIWEEIKTGGAGIVEDDTLNGTVSLLQTWWFKLSDNEKVSLQHSAKNVYRVNFAIESTTSKWIDSLK